MAAACAASTRGPTDSTSTSRVLECPGSMDGSPAAREFADSVVEQVLRYVMQAEEADSCIRRWLVAGETSSATVAHYRVLKQRGGGRCGYHALYNAAAAHAAAQRRPSQFAADRPLLDPQGLHELKDPVSVYSFIGYVERVLGRETLLAKASGDYFWNFDLLSDGVIERVHMKLFLEKTLFPLSLAFPRDILPESPSSNTALLLSAADRIHAERCAKLGETTSIINEFGPSALRLNYDPLKAAASLQPVVTRLQAAAADTAKRACAAGSAGIVARADTPVHHSFILGAGVHWLTIVVHAHAQRRDDVTAVPCVAEQRVAAEQCGGVTLAQHADLTDTSAGLGRRLAEDSVLSGAVAGLAPPCPPSPGGDGTAPPLWVPAYSLHIMDSLNVDCYFSCTAVKQGVVDNFTVEVDERLPPHFVRAGSLEYMHAAEVLTAVLAKALVGKLDLGWFFNHAPTFNLLDRVPRAVTVHRPLRAPHYMQQLLRLVADGLVLAQPLLHEQRWRIRTGPRTFKDIEEEVAQWEHQNLPPPAPTLGRVPSRLQSAVGGAMQDLLWFFETQLPPTVFKRGVTLNLARILMQLHPDVAGAVSPHAVDALLQETDRGIYPHREQPSPRAGGNLKLQQDVWLLHHPAASTAPRCTHGAEHQYLEGALVHDLCAFVQSGLDLLLPPQLSVAGSCCSTDSKDSAASGAGGAPSTSASTSVCAKCPDGEHVPGATGGFSTPPDLVHDAIQEAWGDLTPQQVTLAGKAFPVLQQLKTVMGAFGYWHPPGSLW